MNRKVLMGRLLDLESNCKGCKRPPVDKKIKTGERTSWCRDNCIIYAKIAAIGPRLNDVATEEKRERKTRTQSLPEHHTFAGIKKELLDVAASEQFDVAL